MIIVLDHYVNGPTRHKKYHSELIEIGELLGLSPSSVEIRISNYKARDPEYLSQGKRGFPGGGDHVDAIWKEFFGKNDLLRSEAVAAWKRLREMKEPNDPVIGHSEQYEEGHLKLRTHFQRERSRQLVLDAKTYCKKNKGCLSCEVCGISPSATYGDRGDSAIEAHHRSPMSDLLVPGTSRIEDLALVCANCHRVIHGRLPWLTIEEAGELLTRNLP